MLELLLITLLTTKIMKLLTNEKLCTSPKEMYNFSKTSMALMIEKYKNKNKNSKTTEILEYHSFIFLSLSVERQGKGDTLWSLNLQFKSQSRNLALNIIVCCVCKQVKTRSNLWLTKQRQRPVPFCKARACMTQFSICQLCPLLPGSEFKKKKNREDVL